MSKNKIIISVVALLLLAGIVTGIVVNRGGKKEDGKTIVRVACNLPMTGNLSMFGENIHSGIQMAMGELRNSLHADQIDIVYEYGDNASNPKDAVSVFNMQKMRGFDVYMSCASAQSVAISEQVKNEGKPHIAWSFDPLFLKKEDRVFRPWFDMGNEGRCFVRYIDSKNPKTISFIYQNVSVVCDQFDKTVKPHVQSKSIKILNEEIYDVTTTNFRDIITKVSAAHPDMVIIYGYQSHLEEIIKGLNTSGLKQKGNVLCSFDFLDVQPLLASELLDGIVVNVPHFFVDDTEQVKTWKEKFRSIYGRHPVYTDAYAYDLAYTIYYASKNQLKGGNRNLEESLFTIDFDGVTGHIRYMENGQLESNLQSCMYVNGQFQRIEFESN